MKSLYLITLFIILISSIIHSQWINQNPVPDGNDLWSTFFIDDTGWIVGSEGFIKRTTNAGLDWVQQNSGTTLNLKSVQFINLNTGWVCGEGGLILKTTNGGLNWFSISSGTSENLTDIHFCNVETGYIVGFSGTILKTTDSGFSWTTQISGTTNDLFSVDFVNKFVGYAGGGGYRTSDFSTFLKTTDGGINWFEKPLPAEYTSWSSLNSIEFIDANIGWIGIGYGAMYKGKIYKTTNGGDSWIQQNIGTEEKVTTSHTFNYTLDNGDGIRSIFFKDSNNGYAVSGTIGYARTIITTTNGGSTWTQKYYDWESDGLLSVHVNSAGKGWAVGFAGIIFITEDNSNSWVQILSGIQSYFYSGDDIYSVFCLNKNMGWAVGHRQGGGGGSPIILNTTNGGKIWKTQSYNDGTPGTIRSVYFIDEYFGWALGDNGVWRTTDGGLNWIESGPEGKSLFFINENIGWLVRETFNIYMDAIFKTTDGGSTWVPKATKSGFSVYFVDINNGWVVGKNGSIRKSTDGGETWTTKTSGTTNDLNCVRFYNSYLGMCIGNAGTVLLSTDGGETWIPKSSGINNDLKSVFFTNSTTVWISGSNGKILNSTDLGSNWISYDGVTENDLTSLCFIDENTGWIGGMDGTMIKYQIDVVPVEFESFTAQIKNNTVQLNWRTATEVNNYGFEVERRIDEKEWNKIGFVEGQVNSISPKSYTFTDISLVGGSKFKYRLKQLDTDGTFDYTNEIEVEMTPNVFAVYQNYPNPFNPSTKIRYQLPNKSRVVIKIYDILGSEVMTLLNEEKESGVYEVELNAGGLSSGTYIYQIAAGDPSPGSQQGQGRQSFVETRKMLLIK